MLSLLRIWRSLGDIHSHRVIAMTAVVVYRMSAGRAIRFNRSATDKSISWSIMIISSRMFRRAQGSAAQVRPTESRIDPENDAALTEV
jgi:hypothetical protein